MTEKKTMTKEVLADLIAERVKDHDWVSQGELISNYGDSLRGDLCLAIKGNIVLLVGCSELLLGALEILREEKPRRIEMAPCSMLVMAIDGCPIPVHMPLAKRPPRDGYKSDHYAPICFVRPETARGMSKQASHKEQNHPNDESEP